MYENEIYSGTDTVAESHGIYQTDVNMTSTGQEKDKNEKRSGGFFRKAILSISLGLLFGIFAGIGFYAVQQGMGTGKQDASQVNSTMDPAVFEEYMNNIALKDNMEDGTRYVTYVSSDITGVVEEVMPAMVSILNHYTVTENFWGRTYTEQYEASGSGIIVSENDTEFLIVTNNHVVEDADRLEVTFIDGTTVEAKIKGLDADMDLAVIAVPVAKLDEETRDAISVATLGDSDSLKLGEPVIAIGNALGYGQSVTNGIISALEREVELEDGSIGTFIQTNAAINPGNSGGALLNIQGEVIGINSNKYIDQDVEGMGYAIPITSASPIIADLMERQTRNKVADKDQGYIGIQYEEVTSQFSQRFSIPEGIYVVSSTEGGAAEAAGIMRGDIITKFDGEKVRSETELKNILQYYAAGDSAKITILRPESGEYVEYEIMITLGSRPSGTNK